MLIIIRIIKRLCILFLIIFVAGCSYKLVDNSISTDENIIKNDKTFNDEIDFSKMNMACIGDSITFGYEGDLNVPMSSPLPNELKNILDLNQVDNFGICGSTLATSLEVSMWDRIQTYNDNYDIIYVFGGVNDLNLRVPLGDINSNDVSTIYGALKNIAKTLKTNHNDAFIFFITPIKCDRSDLSYKFPNSLGISLYDISKAINDIGKAYDIPVLDLYFASDFNPITDSYNNDGVHPTQEFVKNNLAPQIAKFIKDNYK